MRSPKSLDIKSTLQLLPERKRLSQLLHSSPRSTDPFAKTRPINLENTRPNMGLSSDSVIAIVGIMCGLPPVILIVWQLFRRWERGCEECGAGRSTPLQRLLVYHAETWTGSCRKRVRDQARRGVRPRKGEPPGGGYGGGRGGSGGVRAVLAITMYRLEGPAESSREGSD